MIPVGTTRSEKISYCLEVEVGPPDARGYNSRTDWLTVRDWDVTDAEARDAAADEQLGEGASRDDHWKQHAMWFIKPDENKAVLCVFRPKVAASGA